MKKIVKISAILAGVAVVLVVATGAVLYSVVDTERIKSELSDLVRSQTGRQLVFKGDVGISVFPWLGMELGPISLSNAPGFGDTPFAEIKRTNVKVRLLPLLSKDIQVKTLNIEGLSLNLERNKQGISNWDDLTNSSAPAKTNSSQTPSSPPSDMDKATNLGLAGLAVGSVEISDANLTWSDAGNGQRASLSKMNLTTGPMALGQSFTFSFSTNAEAAEPPVSGNLSVTAEADLSKDFTTPSLRDVILKLAADGKPLPGEHVDASLAGDILIDLNTSSLKVLGLRLEAMGMKLNGDLQVEQFDTEPVVRTTLNFEEFNPKKIMQALDLPAVETTDPAALQQASGSIEATATTNSVTVKHLDMKLDETSLSGSASVFNFDKPTVQFDLKADTLNVDRYLPPEQKKKTAENDKKEAPDQTKKQKADTGKAKSSGLPKEELRALDMDGTLKVGSLVIYNLRLTDTSVTIKAKDGLIRITPFSAALYGGAIDTNISADMRSNTTKTNLDLGLSNFMLGGFLKDLIGEEKVTGVTNLSLTLSSIGEDWKTLSKTLNGNAKVALHDGVFKGFQILPESVLKKAKETDPQGREAKIKKQQPYKDITASFSIKNGIVSTSDTALAADGLGAVGSGLVDLPNKQIDYRATVDITALPKIPVTIRGNWTDPSISLDTVAFLEETAKGIINVPVNLGKGAGNVGKDLLKGIGTGIQDIFGGKKKEQ
ncbi:AsmA family protein [Desulfovibrio ferrophilus]|uniref:AsmA family protein n=1 Tax=Desulfovibrio ferrophilus TaxID=241368 RepID=A0A2Z6AVI7_9BACT|nr:AsmA family protein [Desulfovibrio ferrophilus]BBD07230.1 AsmA family protein [Desulfovibrio ferrophilus]